ncbi:MAG: hypothetical protein ACQKBY_04985 [Verrucomicrobiales bacterium]
MKNTLKYALMAAVFAAVPAALAEEADCIKVSAAVKKAVEASPSNVLEIVSKEIAANQSCACEIVKAAIVSSDASKALVADIVDTAILEAPEFKDVIAQCAVAIAPDAVSNVQKVMAKYDAAQGESGYSDKGGMAKGGLAKGGMEKAVIEPPYQSNPLDFPDGGSPTNPVGPTPGGPGGMPLIPTLPPVFIGGNIPPVVTQVGGNN